MNEHIDMDAFHETHERLAEIAVKATDDPETAPGVLTELMDRVIKAGEPALLLHYAITHAEDRALRGEAPDPPADSVRTEGASM